MVRVVVAVGANEPLEVRDVLLRTVGPTDVRVRIAAVGVCHSDLSMVDGTLRPSFPLVLGHEAAGVVTETGDHVTSVEVGQHVVIDWAPACRRCWWCVRGELHLCREVEGVASTPGASTPEGDEVHLEMGVGAMAEEVVLPQHAVVPVPDALPFDQAALLGCAVLTGVGAAVNAANVRPGDSVMVVGMGGVGLCAVAGADLAGASRIIAVDTNPAKEPVARAMGATDFVVATKDSGRLVRQLTDGRGPDHGLDCVGNATTIRETWRSVRRGGHAIIVGIGSNEVRASFSPLELFHFNRVLTSSIYGSADPARDIPALAQQILRGQLDITPLITSHIGLDQVGAALSQLGSGTSVRSIAVPG